MLNTVSSILKTMSSKNVSPIGYLVLRYGRRALTICGIILLGTAVFIWFDARQPNPHVDSVIVAGLGLFVLVVMRPLIGKLADKGLRNLESAEGDSK